MMESQTMGRFTFKADQQGLEFVNPCEGSFTHEAVLVHIGLEMPLPSPFHGFSMALVFWNVGDHATVPQALARFPRIKTTIPIEKRAFDVQPATFQWG